MATVADLLRLVKRLEELHTEVQEIIASPHLTMTPLYDVSRGWSTYLNRCVATSSLEDTGAPEKTVLFSLEHTLLDLEGGWYAGPLRPTKLAEMISGRYESDSKAAVEAAVEEEVMAVVEIVEAAEVRVGAATV